MSRISALITLNWIIFFLIMQYALQFIPGISANSLLMLLHGSSVVAVINMGDPIFGGFAEPLMGKILDFLHFNGNAMQALYAYRMSRLVLILYWLIACFAALFIVPDLGGSIKYEY